MDKRFFKKNKFTLFIIGFFLVLLCLLLVSKNILFPSDNSEKYGNRLNGIMEIKDSVLEDAKVKLTENEQVKGVDINITGKIIYFIITVEDSVSLNDAKKIGSSVTSYFSEEVNSYYEYQVFVKKDSEAENNFPIIGYKANENDGFSWSKDREKKETTEE